MSKRTGMESKRVIRILVADDHPLTRHGVKEALAMEAEFEVVAEARDGQEAVDLALRRGPSGTPENAL